WQQRRLQAAAIALLAPLHKHFDALRSALDRLLTAPLIDDPEADVNNDFQRLIQSVASERLRHLEHFAGRERWLQTVCGYLQERLRSAGGYLLLIAIEGTGKSALAAKVTEVLAVPGAPLGPNAVTARQLGGAGIQV